MSIFTSLNAKIYNLTPRTAVLPAFLDKNERKKVAETADTTAYHLVQDGYFPHLATNIRISPDERYLLATGSYPHQTRVFDLVNSTIKFQRNQQCEAVDVAFLGKDWKRFALALDDKTVEIHSQKGKIFGARVPQIPRCLEFDPHEATLCICGDKPEVNRLDLFKGCFRSSLQLQKSATQMRYDRDLELLFVGTDNGVQVFDQRQEDPVGFLPTTSGTTALAADRTRLAVGLDNGELLIFDVRSSVPQKRITQHQHAVQQVDFCAYGDERYVMACDMRQLRAYSLEMEPKFYIEPGTAIRRFQKFNNSGLFAFACEDKFLNFFYAPDLGPAPAWAKDLDAQVSNLDLLQAAGEFQNHKFCTREELNALGLGQLAQTNQVVTYMHGFYVPKALYQKAVGKVSRADVQAKRKQAAAKAAPQPKDERFDDE